MKFMLEVVTHLKNNNMKKIPNYDPTTVDRLKKIQRHATSLYLVLIPSLFSTAMYQYTSVICSTGKYNFVQKTKKTLFQSYMEIPLEKNDGSKLYLLCFML